MIRGLYSSAGSLQTAERNQEVIAHNLANANMPGFRRQLVAFEACAQELQSNGSQMASHNSIGSPGHRPITVFEPGALHATERPLDLALKGNGFFVVDGPNGPLYTRNGGFELSTEGVLQTGNRLPVSGTSGQISIPQGTARIQIREDGTVLADDSEIGRLKLASFSDESKLEQAGTTLFAAPAGVSPLESQAMVQQGYLETSNVQVVDEMVRMIAGMRMYEASQRAMQAISDSVEQRTDLQRP
jgi:flagellar basal-body rod protein FlgF